MINWPAPPSGASTEAAWFRKLLDASKQTEVLPGTGYRVRQTKDGIVLEIVPVQVKGGSTPQTPNSWLRGLWTPTPGSPYMTYDGVILQTGTGAGTYVSMIDNNTNAPDSGLGWLQVATVSGQWL